MDPLADPMPIGGEREPIRLIGPQDYEVAYVAALADPLEWARVVGEGPVSPEAFAARIWQDAVGVFVITSSMARPLAVVSLFGLDERNQTIWVEVSRLGDTRDPQYDEGVADVLDFAFGRWPARAIYCASYAYRESPVSRFDPTLEGVLPAYGFLDGEYWDRMIWRLDRSAWSSRLVAL